MNKIKVNLFLVGAVKAGTTFLQGVLDSNDEINMSIVKEPHYFSSVESRNKASYLKPMKGKKYHSKIVNDLDTYQKLFDDSKKYKYSGDASPSYLYDKNSARLIYSYNSNAKIVILLRNPVDRAYSHYIGEYRTGHEKRKEFIKAFHYDRLLEDKVWGEKGFLYYELGNYVEQVKRYYNFFPESSILILTHEDLKKKEILKKKLSNFLQLDNFSLKNTTQNQGTHPKNIFYLYLKRLLNLSMFNYLLEFIPNKVKLNIKRKMFTNLDKNKLGLSEEEKKALTKIYQPVTNEMLTLYNVKL
jgi:hypothetical protein